jgi:hypothetical protein
MRCIFCKADSSGCQALEHIIPESLGNPELVLPAGVVCDSCNNYFSLKIEKPLLESDYFRHARFRNKVHNKRGRVPSILAFHTQSLLSVEMHRGEDVTNLCAANENESEKFLKSLSENEKGTLLVLIPEQPDDYTFSRFLGKVALEVATDRVLEVPGGLDEIIDKRELDELRSYVRYGDPRISWPFHAREIYVEGRPFYDEEIYEVLHEYMLLYTEAQELYLVLAIFGVEYALNLGGPEITGYINWLEEHEHRSPLYLEDTKIHYQTIK